MNNTTVAAISTPYGRGGISVIRISGENALRVAEKVFKPLSGKALSDFLSASVNRECAYREKDMDF